jgi:hypothetical protein
VWKAFAGEASAASGSLGTLQLSIPENMKLNMQDRQPETQTPVSPTGVVPAMPFLRGLLLCFTAAVVLLAPGKARAVDLDPVLVGKWPAVTGGESAGAVAIQNDLVFVAIGAYPLSQARSGLAIFDESNPANPQRVGGYNIQAARAVAVLGDYAYLASWFTGLHIVDVSDPSNPYSAGGYAIEYLLSDVAVSGDYVCMAASGAGIQPIDVIDPSSPQKVGGCSKLSARSV